MRSIRFITFTFIIAGPLSSSVAALDIDRLWLPTEFRGQYLKLRDAALAAEATPQCQEVLRGTLDLDQSSSELSVYRILCRQENGTSYTEFVDGDTLQPRSLTPDPAPPELAHEREQRLAQEEQSEKVDEDSTAEVAVAERGVGTAAEADEPPPQSSEVQRRRILGEACQSEILARTAMMLDLVWLTERPLVEVLANGQLRYTAEFNAKDMWSTELHYEAVCTISTPQELVVVVSPRNPGVETAPVYLP